MRINLLNGDMTCLLLIALITGIRKGIKLCMFIQNPKNSHRNRTDQALVLASKKSTP